jgi:hypothetical protein
MLETSCLRTGDDKSAVIKWLLSRWHHDCVSVRSSVRGFAPPKRAKQVRGLSDIDYRIQALKKEVEKGRLASAVSRARRALGLQSEPPRGTHGIDGFMN